MLVWSKHVIEYRLILLLPRGSSFSVLRSALFPPASFYTVLHAMFYTAFHAVFLLFLLLLQIRIDFRPLVSQPIPHQLQNPHDSENHLPQQRTVLPLTHAIIICHVLYDGPRIPRHSLDRFLVLLFNLGQNGLLTRLRSCNVLLCLNMPQGSHSLHVSQLLHLVVIHEQLFILLHCLPLIPHKFEPTCNSPICCFISSTYSQYIWYTSSFYSSYTLTCGTRSGIVCSLRLYSSESRVYSSISVWESAMSEKRRSAFYT